MSAETSGLRLLVASDATAEGELLQAARQGDQRALRQLYDRHAPQVERVLSRLMGVGDDVCDALQDTFSTAFQRLGEVRTPDGFRPWILQIAVYTARGKLRQRRRMRWLYFLLPEQQPELPTPCSAERYEAAEALRETYAVLDRMPLDERLAFAMRYIEGMDLQSAAEGCGVSLATLKRRLLRAEQRFVAAAGRAPGLRPWLEGGTTWTGRKEG